MSRYGFSLHELAMQLGTTPHKIRPVVEALTAGGYVRPMNCGRTTRYIMEDAELIRRTFECSEQEQQAKIKQVIDRANAKSLRLTRGIDLD